MPNEIKNIFSIEFPGVDEFVASLRKADKASGELAQGLEDSEKEAKKLMESVNNVSFNGITKELVDVKRKLDTALGSDVGKEFGNALDEALKRISSNSVQLQKFIRDLKRELEKGDLPAKEYQKLSESILEAEGALRELKETEQVRQKAFTASNLEVVADAAGVLANGYQAAVAATQLFGIENEDLLKSIAKLQAIMALTNSLESISNTLKGNSIALVRGQAIADGLATRAKTLYTTAVNISSTALGRFKLALAATGIGLAIVAVAALIQNWDKLAGSVNRISEEQKLYNEITRATASTVGEATTNVRQVDDAFRSAKNGLISKDDALKIYNDTLGDTIGKADSYNEAEALFIANSSRYIQSVQARSRAEALRAKSIELETQLIDLTIQGQEDLAKINQDPSLAKGLENARTGFELLAQGQFAADPLLAAYQNTLDRQVDIQNQRDKINNQFVEAEIESQKLSFNTQKNTSIAGGKVRVDNARQTSAKIIDYYQLELDALRKRNTEKVTILLKEKIGQDQLFKDEQLSQDTHNLNLLLLQREFLLEVQEANSKFKKDNTDNAKSIADINLTIIESRKKLFDTLTRLENERIIEASDNNLKLFGLDKDSQAKFKAALDQQQKDLAEYNSLIAEFAEEDAPNTASPTERLDNIRTVAQAAIQAEEQILNALSEAEQRKQQILDQSIQTQQNRITQAIAFSEKTGEDYVSIEQDRLAKLEEERRESARRQLALDTALRASSILTAIAGALADTKGESISAAARVATIIGAIAQGAALVASLNSNAPNLWEGTDYAVSDTLGAAPKRGRDAYNVNVDKDERVLAKKYNDPIRNIHSKDIPRLVNLGLNPKLDYPAMAAANQNYVSNTTVQSLSTKKLEDKVDKMTAALAALQMNVKLDKKGFAASIASHMEMQNILKNV